MHSNGSFLTSQVGDNTYDTTVERLKYPWLNAAYLKARCSDRCISSFLQQMSSVSLTSTASPFMDMPMTCRSTTTVSLTTCTTSNPGLSTASVVSGSGWRTIDSSSTRRKPFGLSSGQVYVRVDRDQRVLHSSIQDSPQPRIRPGSIFESGISRHQADEYIVLSHTSAAYDPSTNDACHALVRALVLSRLDYCHGLLATAPDYRLA